MRSPTATLALVAGLALVSTACAEKTDVERGRLALDSRCARCHAIGESGASAHPEALPFREIVRRYPPESLAEALAEGIVTGHPDMPEFVLSPEEIGTVIAYLTTLTPNHR